MENQEKLYYGIEDLTINGIADDDGADYAVVEFNDLEDALFCLDEKSIDCLFSSKELAESYCKLFMRMNMSVRDILEFLPE